MNTKKNILFIYLALNFAHFSLFTMEDLTPINSQLQGKDSNKKCTSLKYKALIKIIEMVNAKMITSEYVQEKLPGDLILIFKCFLAKESGYYQDKQDFLRVLNSDLSQKNNKHTERKISLFNQIRRKFVNDYKIKAPTKIEDILVTASFFGIIQLVSLLINDACINPNSFGKIYDAGTSIDQPITPLMAACLSGKNETINLLIDANADITLRDRFGITALDYAMIDNSSDLHNLDYCLVLTPVYHHIVVGGLIFPFPKIFKNQMIKQKIKDKNTDEILEILFSKISPNFNDLKFAIAICNLSATKFILGLNILNQKEILQNAIDWVQSVEQHINNLNFFGGDVNTDQYIATLSQIKSLLVNELDKINTSDEKLK